MGIPSGKLVYTAIRRWFVDRPSIPFTGGFLNKFEEDFMSKDEAELLEKFRKLTPENKAIAQGNVAVQLATQENTLKGMKRRNVKAKARKLA
jgi:hypothetical protein